MMINGVQAKDIVEKSIRDGLVERPVHLQPTLAPEEQKELSETILAARKRMAARQSHEDRSDRVRGMAAPGQVNVIDGKTAAQIVASSVIQGNISGQQASPSALDVFAATYQEPVREVRQKDWTRESMQRLRANRRAFNKFLEFFGATN
jgi:hypothetical protein